MKITLVIDYEEKPNGDNVIELRTINDFDIPISQASILGILELAKVDILREEVYDD